MKVKDVMHKGAVVVEAASPLKTVARQLRDRDIGAAPVRADGRIIGVITDRDITCRGVAGEKDFATLTAREVMTSNVATCRPNDDIDRVVELMEQRKIRRMPVLDEDDLPVGMVSLGDISHRLPDRTSGEVLRAVSAHHG